MSYHYLFLLVYVCSVAALFVFYLWSLIRGSADETVLPEEPVSRLAKIVPYSEIKSAEVGQYAEFAAYKRN
ncbi:MAG: hypothetical protein P4L77_09710 [Sulfuriferula sp.]|nr:hypothetical protein [Sulfuriferula sp.]